MDKNCQIVKTDQNVQVAEVEKKKIKQTLPKKEAMHELY